MSSIVSSSPLPRAADRPCSGFSVGASLGAAALGLLGVATTSNAWLDLVRIGVQDEEASHVWLVPLVFLWLFWSRRQRLPQCRVTGQWVGVGCVAAGWLLWSYGYRYQFQSLWHGGAVLLTVGAVLSVFGLDLLLRFFPAFVALTFLIPVPGRARLHVAEPLQRVTAWLTQNVSEVLGISVERFGSLLSVNGTDIAIAEACNGMRMVVTLFLACYLFAFVTPLRTWVRVLIIALAPAVAVICNIVRLVPTVWMYGHGSRESASAFHDASGWVMLVLAFLLLKSSVEVLRWAGVAVEPPAPAVSGNLGRRGEGVVRVKRSQLICMLASSALLMGAAADRLSLPNPAQAASYHQSVRNAADELPSRAGDWIATELPPPPEAIEQLRPNVLLCRAYRNVQTGRQVTFMLVQCGDVRDLIVHYPPVCYPGRGLRLTSAKARTVALGGMRIPVTRYEFESNTYRRSAQVCVDNFMILPDGRMKSNMDQMEREIGLSNRYFGAAQVQVVSEGTAAVEERDQAFTQIVGAYEPLIRAMAGGVQR